MPQLHFPVACVTAHIYNSTTVRYGVWGMSVIQEIKDRLDIVQYIQQYVPLKKAGRNYKACCPFHTEKTPSFIVNPDRQSWRCFGSCSEGGDIFSFVQKYHGWSFAEALQELGKQAGVEVHKQTPQQKEHNEELERLRSLLKTAADAYHQFLLNQDNDDARATLQYAREKRGLTDETIQHFCIGYAPPGWQNMLEHLLELGYEEKQVVDSGLAIRNDSGRVYDRFRNRLMIPIRDARGRVIGFGARALDPDDNAKYINSPQTSVFDKSHVLFGLDSAKRAIRDSETAVIVEGYMDVIQAQQAGFTNVVAQMGTALTETQLKLIVPRYAQKIILALDSDAAGQSATRRSLEVARRTLQADYAGRMSVDIRILQIPGAKDPDDLLRETPEQWQTLVDNAKPVAEYVIEAEMATLPENASLQERESLARRVLPILLASESNLYRKDNIQKLALRLRIAESDLLAWAQEQRRTEAARPPREPQPPPPSYDDLPPEPPPDIDEVVIPLPASAARPHPGQNNRDMEAQCLYLLFLNPDLYYQTNRKLRELAGENANLMTEALGNLCAADFSQSEYHILMQSLQSALNQDELDPLDYLHDNLDPTLLSEMESLLTEQTRVCHRLRNRWKGELTAVWKNHERHVMPRIDPGDELMRGALYLRARRLQREREELECMQIDLQQNGDDVFGHETTKRMFLLIQAQRLLDAELEQWSKLTNSGRGQSENAESVPGGGI